MHDTSDLPLIVHRLIEAYLVVGESAKAARQIGMSPERARRLLKSEPVEVALAVRQAQLRGEAPDVHDGEFIPAPRDDA